MKLRSLAFIVLLGLGTTSGSQVLAASAVDVAKSASVLVACDNEQGSGTVVNGVDGYVLTAGHVVINDLQTGRLADACTVAFADDQGRPRYEYETSIVRAVYNEKLNQDFAILKIGATVGREHLSRPFPSLVTNEFSAKGDVVHVLGYPGPADVFVATNGTITDYEGGFIDTTAEIAPGDSGGTAVDDQGRLIGVPTRILTTYVGSNGHNEISYQLVDIRAVMNWLDTFGQNEHDKFFTHADYTRYHSSAVYIMQQNLGCLDLARTPSVSAVYCLMGDGTRLAFPTDTTYFSWFSDFKQVITTEISNLADYKLVRNVTFKPGTLVKSRTAPAVYVVIDSFGTLRKIPSEQKAMELWGPAWAGLVFDIPDEFWTNYTIGQPLEP